MPDPAGAARSEAPYRALFENLAAGAARCRVASARPGAALEILERNRAFVVAHLGVPEIAALCAQVAARGQPETRQLRSGGAELSASAYPVTGDEVMLVIEDITARTRLEQRARDYQNRFEQAFHGNAAAMVIAHQHDLRIIEVNQRWLEMFETTRDDVIGRTPVELGLITEHRARTRIAEHKRFAEGYEVELELRSRSGKPLTVLASAKPIELAEGACTLTTLIDITARKHAEEAFALAFRASPAGMMLVDVASDTVIAVNERQLEMTCATRDDYVGRRVDDLVLIAKPSRGELLSEMTRAGRLDSCEVQLACKGGPGVWTLASVEQITLHGAPHRLSVFTDITARKRFERRLVTQHVVGLSLAETSSLELGVPHVLEALCRAEGWTCGGVWWELPGQPGLQRCGAWCDPAVAACAMTGGALDGLVARVAASRTAEKIVLDGELRHAVAFPILRGDVALGVLAMAAPVGDGAIDPTEHALFDSVGRMLGLFLERTRAELSLRELNLELERRVFERTRALETSNRDLEAFTSTVSHDLRAPLRAIQGFSRILLDDFAAALPEEARGLLRRIVASEGRLRALIGDLLAFSRLGRGELQRREIELDPVVRSVLDELLVGRALGARLDLRVQPLGTCHADPSLLRAVWTNLIDNALKYARNRDPMVIEIGREIRDREVTYYVQDNGIGFDPRLADRLFGVFQRLHSDSEFEGTGIGLANVRRIVERHHGRVAAIARPGGGSRFEFTLGAG